MSWISEILARRPHVNRRFKFSLSYNIISPVTVELEYAPDGFYKGETRFVRNKTYRGLFRTVTVGELTFIRDGKTTIEGLYGLFGIDVDIFLVVEIFVDGAYQPYATLKLDLATLKFDNVSLKVQAVDESLIEKVKNREDILVNLFSTTSLDGNTIADFPIGLHMPDTSVHRLADWGLDAAGNTSPVHVLPVTLNNGADYDSAEAITPANNPDSKAGAFFYESQSIRYAKINVDVSGDIQPKTTGTDALTYTLYLLIFDFNGNQISKQALAGIDSSGTGELQINMSESKYINLSEGDSVELQGEWTAAGNEDDYELTYSDITIEFHEDYTGNAAKDVKAFGAYEAFYRVIQLLTGENNLLSSEVFARPDTPQPCTTCNTAEANTFLIKGRLLRAAENTFGVTLKDLFQSLNAIYNIGMGFENGKFVVERINHFFDNTELDISDRVTEDIIETSVAPDLIYKSIKVGYSKFGKDKEQSGYEFNTQSEFTTPVRSVTTTLNIVSKYRADGTSIMRLLNDTDLSKNVDGDNDIFIIKAVDTGGGNYVATTSQPINYISGAPYAKKSYNIEITPARNLRTWGKFITVGLVSDGINPSAIKIRWQDTSNNYNLASELIWEDDIVHENGDVGYLELDPPIISPERLRVKVPLTLDEINTIFVNPNLKIRLTDDKAGWIDNLVINNETNEAEITLIKAV